MRPLLRVTLVDLHGENVAAAHRGGWREVNCLAWTDIQDLPMTSGTAFVSPANSLGFMDGGIDYVLSRVMFPGIEARVKEAIAALGIETLLGRRHLPIGRAVCVPTQHPGVHLIAAPTMWLPQDVRGTHNAYHAMYAVLTCASAIPDVNKIVVSGLGTGCGLMSSDVAVSQMRDAYRDFYSGSPARFSAEQIKEEQPTWYENTEFKHIPPGSVRVVL